LLSEIKINKFKHKIVPPGVKNVPVIAINSELIKPTVILNNVDI
jgi:hypothetical protein